MYDNLNLFAFSKDNATLKDKVEIQTKFDNEKYNICATKVHKVEKISLTIENLQQHTQLACIEKGLNLLNKGRFDKSYFSKAFRKDCYYSIKDDDAQIVLKQNDKDLNYPDLKLLQGYKSTAHYCKAGIFTKTAISNKPIASCTLWDLIDYHGLTNVIKRFTKTENGQYYTAMVLYSKEFIRIEGFATDFNLDSTFDFRGTPVTFRAYYEKKLGRKPKEERCLIKFRNNYYLPQCIVLSANNDMQTPQTKQRIRNQFTNLPAQKTIEKGLQLNNQLNQHSRSTLKMFETEIKRDQSNMRNLIPTTVPAYHLIEPTIYIYSNQHTKIPVPGTQLIGKNWKNMGAVMAPPWQDVKDKFNYYSLDWCIVHERHHEFEARTIVDKFNFFIQKLRKFNPRPLNEPRLIQVDYRNLNEIQNQVKNNSTKFSVALFIISNDKQGSKNKIDISKKINFDNKYDYNNSNNNCNDFFNENYDNSNGSGNRYNNDNRDRRHSRKTRVDTQFITSYMAKNKHAVNSVCESM